MTETDTVYAQGHIEGRHLKRHGTCTHNCISCNMSGSKFQARHNPYSTYDSLHDVYEHGYQSGRASEYVHPAEKLMPNP